MLKITAIPGDEFLATRQVRLRVDESFGGISEKTAEIDVLTGSGGGDCGIPFVVGQQYLVHAGRGQDGELHTGVCDDTRHARAAGAVLWMLRRRKSGQPEPSLMGQIARAERMFNGFLGEDERWTPLPGFRLRLTSGHATFETTSTPEGFYWFDNIPPGEYRFAADLPQDVELSLESWDDRPPVWKRGDYCSELYPIVISTASIEGHVLDQSGQPIYGIVTIFPAASKTLPDGRQEYWKSADRERPFRFTHIPPGDYLLMVNSNDKPDSSTPYRRTFYPSALDRASATPVTVHPGEQVTGIDIRTTSVLTRQLTVRLRWADGRPTESIWVTAGENGDTENRDSVKTNLQGVARLNLQPNSAYEITAEVNCSVPKRFGPPYAAILAARASLAPGDGQTTITLTLPAAACPTGSSQN